MWAITVLCQEERDSEHTHSHCSLVWCCSWQSSDIAVGGVVELLPPQNLWAPVSASGLFWTLGGCNSQPVVAFTVMKSYILVVFGFLVRADLELAGEQSLSRFGVTPHWRGAWLEGGPGKPHLPAGGASLALQQLLPGQAAVWLPRCLCLEVVGHLLFQITEVSGI